MDWKKILTESGVVLSVAEMARDKIAEKINQELEDKLEDTRNRLTMSEMDLKNARYERDEARRELEDTQNVLRSTRQALIEAQSQIGKLTRSAD